MKTLLTTILFLLCSIGASAQDYLDLVERAMKATENDSIHLAVDLYSQALKASPSEPRNALVYTNMGKLQERLGKTGDALQSYTRAIEIFPHTIVFLRARADLYLRLGIYDAAITDYEKILDLQPSTPHPSSIPSLLGYAYTRIQKFDKARRYINQALAADPDDYMAKLGHAVILLSTGHLPEARTNVDLLIHQHPDKAESYAIRADMERQADQYELAVEDITQAITLDPSNRNYILARANLHYSQRQYAKALPDYLKCIELGVPRSAINTQLQKCRDASTH